MITCLIATTGDPSTQAHQQAAFWPDCRTLAKSTHPWRTASKAEPPYEPWTGCAQVGGLAAGSGGVWRSLSASGRWESGEGWIAGYSARMQTPGASAVQEVCLPSPAMELLREGIPRSRGLAHSSRQTPSLALQCWQVAGLRDAQPPTCIHCTDAQFSQQHLAFRHPVLLMLLPSPKHCCACLGAGLQLPLGAGQLRAPALRQLPGARRAAGAALRSRRRRGGHYRGVRGRGGGACAEPGAAGQHAARWRFLRGGAALEQGWLRERERLARERRMVRRRRSAHLPGAHALFSLFLHISILLPQGAFCPACFVRCPQLI